MSTWHAISLQIPTACQPARFHTGKCVFFFFFYVFILLHCRNKILLFSFCSNINVANNTLARSQYVCVFVHAFALVVWWNRNQQLRLAVSQTAREKVKVVINIVIIISDKPKYFILLFIFFFVRPVPLWNCGNSCVPTDSQLNCWKCIFTKTTRTAAQHIVLHRKGEH